MNVTQALLESLPEPHFILSKDYAVIAANSAFLGLLQVSFEDLLTQGIEPFWPTAHQGCQLSSEHTTEFIDLQARSVSARISCQVSECIVVRVLASAAPGESLKLHHKQRIETLGIIAGGVAHDFNNVLTGILGHIAYMKHVLPANHQGSESLSAIEEGALKAAGLTQQILNFSRLEASEQLSEVDISSTLQAVLLLLKSAIPARISLQTTPHARSFSVLASEVNIAQILINLIINARDAISDHGEIAISLEPELAESSVLELFGGEPAASHYGVIQVRDTGSGMTDQVKSRLFEPYFTTKGGAGTGLGLATINSIVRQLGGVVDVESQLGEGTVFRIVLPVVVQGAGESRQESSAAIIGGLAGPAAGSGEKILVIDDEDAVRNVLGLSLAHLGYAVDTAASGREGIEKFQAARGAYALVILDLLMPGLSGEDVFYRLQELHPDVPVMIVSGFSSAHVVQRILDDGGRDFIQKPFSIEVLSEKVRGCLGV
jgi:two-component system cell cycle sensor histidine kinase/response regulator CckA